MDKQNEVYLATLPNNVCEDLTHLHVTVRAKVVDGHLIGYVASPVHNRESYARYRHSRNPTRGRTRETSNSAHTASRAIATSGISQKRKPSKPGYKSPDIHRDGGVTFAITAPDASHVELAERFSDGIDHFTMEKDDQGVWRKTLAGLEGGIYKYGFSIDGSTLTADPLNPKVYSRNMEPTAWSFLTLPSADGNMFYELSDVPHGVVHSHVYQANSLLRTRRLHVYTPPAYETTTDWQYPVLYLLHGGGDMANGFLVAGHVDMILDNLIAAGKAKPMIVLMPRSKGATPYQRLTNGQLDRSRNFAEFEKTFLADIAPLVKSNYRINPARKDHAVAGFSVGAALARTIGLKHLDRFAWVGQFSGGTRLEDDYDETFAPIFHHVDKTNKLLKLYWVSGPTGENSLPSFHQRLADAGIKFVSRPGRFGHSYRTCRHILNNEFLPRLFRDRAD